MRPTQSTSPVRSRVSALVAAGVAVLLTAVPAAAHEGHGTPTPAGPLSGVSPVGVGVALAGLLVATGALLLSREGVLTERVRSAAFGVGAALLLAGGALSVVAF